MTDFNSTELFQGKSFSDLLKDIYTNRNDKEERIQILIDELRPLIKNSTDALSLVPLLKEYMDVAVKNDEHLVKMAATVQRAITRTTSDSNDNLVMSDDELNELMDEYKKTDKSTIKQLKSTTDKVDEFLNDEEEDVTS